MTAHELLVQLRVLNVRISLEGGRLRVVEPSSGILSDEIWSELGRNKEELHRVLQHAVQARLTAAPIRPCEHPKNIPLSLAQQRLWFLSQMEGVSELYHIPMGWRLSGELDRHALKQALNRILLRHEALRTSFYDVCGQPFQRVVASDHGFELQQQDVSGHPERAMELERRMREEAGCPFDLEHGPLIRGQLIRIAAQEHLMLITMHHIVSDGWSIGVFNQELSALYGAYRAGDADPLPPLAIQYADYALWQREQLSGEVLQREADYWRDRLKGAPGLLELPTDRPRPAQQTFAGDAVKLELDARLTQELKALGRRHGMTLYMLAVAAWGVVLSRLSRQEEVVIGTVTANRGRPEIESLIGFFVNTQALRVDVRGSVTELLREVKALILEAQEHQELPFDRVVEIVKPLRSLGHTPIFQVMLTWTGNEGASLQLPGLSVKPMQTGYLASKFDLELNLRTADERFEGELRYATALFDRGTMERHAGYVRTALAAMVAGERQPVAGIDLLSHAERRQLLVEWNDTGSNYRRDVCIHELFEEQADRTPGAVALEYEEQQLTYAGLNHRANQLGWFLRKLGVGPDVRVGICLERGLEMMVALLGVLKAGGGYVPLDPAHGGDRLSYLARDAQTEVLLTQSQFRSLLPDYHGRLIELDRNSQIISEESGSSCVSRVTPENLAYVIYTSGSTGRPKGVTVEHRQVCNQLFWAGAALDLGPADRVLQKTSLSVDASIVETFVPLTRGARIIIARPRGEQDVDYLVRLICERAITYLDVVPALLEQLLDHPMFNRCTSLRVTCCGGDVLKPESVRAFHQIAPGLLWNAYGPTEATVQSTFFVCTKDTQNALIGRPIANTQIYILDGSLEPVPTGAAGELYIGGTGVARGYLNRPKLTAERFLADPFSSVVGARMYKTGDVGRYLGDGNIEFLGRNDQQVKIRGFRIELGEIEARLADHPRVREAVVLAREDQPGDRRLVAYYVAEENARLSAEGLRTHLAVRLPEYMVPAAYVAMDKLPLSANGKLDRKALPSPDAAAYVTRRYEAPMGEIESTVARIWEDVLKLERIGRHDNFFQLGGHSLLIVKVKNLLHQAGIETTVAHFFNHPTIESFAALLAETSASSLRRGAQRIRGGTQTTLFLVHDGYGDELYFSALAQYLPRELPVYGLPSVPPGEPPRRTLHGMAERMVSLIQEVQALEPYRLAGWSFGGVLAYEIAQQLLDQGHALEFLGLIDAFCPQDDGATDSPERTAEAILVDLCEKQKAAKSRAPSAMPQFDPPDSNLDFDELFSHYRAMQVLPENFEQLASHEARALCRNLEIHSRAMAAYRARPISIPVHLFVASDRPPGSPAVTSTLGWERFVPAYLLYAQSVPGTHHSMMKPPHIEVLGQRLMESLTMAETKTHSSQVLQVSD